MKPLLLKACHIPNLITSLRIVLVVPLLWALVQGHYGAALLLLVVAGVSDALDGFLARSCGWTSELGGLLDPIADKLLLAGAILVLGWRGELPGWLVALVLLRDLVIVGGAASYHLLIERFSAAPLRLSKFNTLIQLGLVCAVIVHGMMPVPEWVLTGLIALTALMSLWSGAAYVRQWSRRAWNRPQSGRIDQA